MKAIFADIQRLKMTDAVFGLIRQADGQPQFRTLIRRF